MHFQNFLGINGTCRRAEMQFGVVKSGRGGCHGLCLVAYFKWSLRAHGLRHWYWQQRDFPPYNEDWKLTLVQINERWRLAWHEHDQWKISKMTRSSWPLSSVRKAVIITELSLSLSSVYFGCWFKVIFVAYMGAILSLNWTFFPFNVVLFFCEFKIISAWVSVADCFAPSYRSCFVAVTVFTTGSVFTFHWSSSCLVSVPTLAERYSPSLTLQGVCCCIQNYFCPW